MKITREVTPSYWQNNSGDVYDEVVDGKVTRIRHRNRKPMVLMTEADFIKMAKGVGDERD